MHWDALSEQRTKIGTHVCSGEDEKEHNGVRKGIGVQDGSNGTDPSRIGAVV
jgi:hypothetical protein